MSGGVELQHKPRTARTYQAQDLFQAIESDRGDSAAAKPARDSVLRKGRPEVPQAPDERMFVRGRVLLDQIHHGLTNLPKRRRIFVLQDVQQHPAQIQRKPARFDERVTRQGQKTLLGVCLLTELRHSGGQLAGEAPMDFRVDRQGTVKLESGFSEERTPIFDLVLRQDLEIGKAGIRRPNGMRSSFPAEHGKGV